MKRMIILADLHCGHRSGLTPPKYWINSEEDGFLGKVAQFERDLWKWYSETIEKCKPIDVIVVNGDAIDGKGEKSGGTELIRTDRLEQVRMAAECIRIAEAKDVFIIAGTPYHVGKEEDFESSLADDLGAHFSNHEFIKCEDVKFDFKHKVSSSIIPHGRWTAPRRSALWNSMQAERGMQESLDFLIRSHVHYYTLSEDAIKTVITTPALQGWTKFGSKECEGTNDVGFLQFDCENGEAGLTKYFYDMREFKAEFVEIK